MTQVPLCSSNDCIKALERAGFERTHGTGSHQAMRKRTPDHTIVVIVVLNKRPIPRGTMRNIIKQAEMSVDEFIEYLKGKRAE